MINFQNKQAFQIPGLTIIREGITGTGKAAVTLSVKALAVAPIVLGVSVAGLQSMLTSPKAERDLAMKRMVKDDLEKTVALLKRRGELDQESQRRGGIPGGRTLHI